MTGRPPLTPAQRGRRSARLSESAEFIRAAREQLGTELDPLTQAQFAALVGVSRSLVTSWEMARSVVGAKHRAAIAGLLANRKAGNSAE